MVVRDRSCLVVGGGDIAFRKVTLLLKAGGRVTVVAPTLCNALAQLWQAKRINHRAAAFCSADLTATTLVIAATDDESVNRQVSELCQAQNLLVNVVDQPTLCNFIMPAMVDRSPILVAVSTGGAAPVLARLLRARLESLIPAAYGRLASLVASFRDEVKNRLPSSRRRAFWETILQGPVAELVFSGQDETACSALETALSEAEKKDQQSQGEVYLVGGGPGDPDLLTFRALRLMQQADVVLYDRLVAPAVLELVRRDAERIYVGKMRNDHVLPQGDINQLLIRLAKQGKRVLRLKGGDPFLFGRGGEELQRLMQEGIPFQVVPGITAASGCAAYAGIPLTHRDHAQSCLFVTGHLRDGSVDLNWETLVQPQQTVVFYMGLHGIGLICAKLMEHGLPETFPAALVEQGTMPEQRVFIDTVGGLPERVKKAQLRAPTLIIIGKVVTLHKDLAWFKGNI